MADIKIKARGTVKVLDKTVVGTERLKDNIVNIKDSSERAYKDDSYSSTDYASNKIQNAEKQVVKRGTEEFNKKGYKSFRDTKNNIKNAKKQIESYRTQTKGKNLEKKVKGTIKTKDNLRKVKGSIKTSKNSTKLAKKSIKTTEKVAKNSAKVAKETAKNAKRAAQMAKKAAQAAAKATKAAIKVMIQVIKAIVKAAASLIKLLIAGGWISVIIILVVCLFGGILAIFNSGGDNDTRNMWNGDIVKVAESQIGVSGGDPYWSWYGFDERVEWCACFVSWCADQCGYLEGNYHIEKPKLDQSGIEEQTVADEVISFPKYSGVGDGIQKFKNKSMWQDRNKDDKNYIPHKGDIIFFDWEVDGSSDHTGIVEYYDEGANKVHTIEGNSGDMVKRQEYSLTDERIVGYGTPFYFYN